MDAKEEVFDFESGEYSGVAWMIGDFYMNSEDRLENRVTHICTDKFNFIRASIDDIQNLRDQGYRVNLNN